MKRIACVLFAAAACGGSSGPVVVDSHSGVPIALTAYSIAKVALRTSATTFVRVLDNSDEALPISCVDDAPCGGAPAVCDQSPGSATFHFCVRPVTSKALLYVQNLDPVTPTATFSVPCDGSPYDVEVYAGAKGAMNIVGAVFTGSVTLDANCVVTTGPGWVQTPSAELPTLVAPKVYAGITSAPYDKYTLQLANVRTPWSGPIIAAVNTLQCGGLAPNGGTLATFNAPPASAAPPPIDCQGDFNLDASLLTSGDVPWRYTATTTIDPVKTGGVGFPP